MWEHSEPLGIDGKPVLTGGLGKSVAIFGVAVNKQTDTEPVIFSYQSLVSVMVIVAAYTTVFFLRYMFESSIT